MDGMGIYNTTGAEANPKHCSPVTLCDEWPRFGRFVFVLSCAVFGTLSAGYFVSSFFVERTLKSVGHVFLALLGVADLLINTIIMPVSAVVLLSGQWDNIYVCRTLHFIGITSTYCYSIYFLMVAANGYFKYCRPKNEYEIFLGMGVGLVSLVIFFVSAALAGVGVFLDQDYDYCTRQHYGNFYFRLSTTVIVYIIPACLTLTFMFYTSSGIQRRARKCSSYKKSRSFKRDSSLNAINIVASLLYEVAWIPPLFIVYENPATTDMKYYITVWLGLLRSTITGTIYGIAHRSFRRAYANIFHYCCCKSNLAGSLTGRHRRVMHYKTGGNAEGRVNIRHEAYRTGKPKRGPSTSHEDQEL